MPEYFGSIYQKKGGDEALQKRYARLQEIAREDGIMGPEQEGLIPDEVKNAFSRLADIISRPNYAIAGAFDTLAGTGKKGESVPNRVLRELFSGVGGLEGDKEFFGEVLKQSGVGEGGRLSDIVGEDSLLTLRGRFDPTLRGTAGLALDILTDPLTWIGAPAKGAAKVMSSGGEVFAINAAGRAAQIAAYEKRVLQRAKKFMSTDEIAKLQKADRFDQIEMRVLTEEVNSAAYTAAGQEAAQGLGRQQITNEIMREAGGDVADRILAGERVLEEARGLRFRPPVPGVDIPLGVDRALTGGARKAADVLTEALQSTQRGKILVDRFDEYGRHLHQLFTRVNPLAKRLKAYEIREAERFAMHQSADHLARIDVAHIFGGSKLANKVNEKGWKLLTKAIDNPDAHTQAWVSHAVNTLKISQADAMGIMERWNALTAQMAKKELGARLLDEATFAGRYIPHLRKRKLPGAAQTQLEQIKTFKGADIGGFAEHRVFRTLDEYEEFLTRQGLDPDLYIEYNPLKLMTKRMEAHYKAMVNEQFGQDIIRMFSVQESSGLRILREALRDAEVKPTAKQQEIINRIKANSTTFTGSKDPKDALDALLPGRSKKAAGKRPGLEDLKGDTNVADFKSLPSGVKAGLMYEMLGNVQTLEHLERILNKYGGAFDKIHNASIVKARDAIRNGGKIDLGKVTYAGQPFRRHRFTSGSLKGQEYDLPKGIVDDFENFEKQFPLNPEVKAWLRLFDRLTNTFKLSVTSLFPAFNTRNAYSNVSASAMDIGLQALNPKAHVQILNILRGADGTLTTYNGKKIPYSVVRRELDTMGIRIDRLKLAEMTGEATAIPGVNIALTSRKSPLRFAQEGASLIENEARAMHYITLRRRGYAAGDAMTQTNKFLFDYSNLSAFEQNVMRRIVPFYTWQRKNIERQIKNLYEHPGRVAARAKIFAGDRGPENEMLPDYLRGNMLVTLTPPSGKSKSLLTGIDLPVRNVDVLWAGGFGQTLRENLNMVNPLLKAPLEIALNMDSFTNRPIRGQQWMGRMGPTFEKLPKRMKEYINLDKIQTKDGRTVYRADGLKVYLITKGLFLSRFLSTSIDINEFAQSFKGDEGANLATLTKIMSGLNLREFDLTEEQEAILRNNMNRLQDALLETGGARNITVPARPKKKAPSFLRVPTIGGTQ